MYAFFYNNTITHNFVYFATKIARGNLGKVDNLDNLDDFQTQNSKILGKKHPL